MYEESEDAQPVVNGDGDDPLTRHALSIVPRLGAVSADESASVEVDQHRQPFPRRLCGRPNIQIEAVLAHAVGAEDHVIEDAELHGASTESVRLANAFPALYRLRLSPSEIAERRSGGRNPLVRPDSGSGIARAFQYAASRT